MLDEAGQSLHPLAQKDLISFFDNLAKTNQLIYTTHSPFLVDTSNIDRAKVVYSDDDGLTVVSSDLRAADDKLNEKFSTSSYKITLKKGITQNLVAYLFKGNKKAMVYISDLPKKGYVKIETSFTLLTTKIDKECDEKYYILDVELHTGKTHQIRAHLAHIGLPIIGDGKYGINEVNKKFGSKTQELCSYKLKFNFTKDAGELNYLRDKEISLSYTSYLC